MATSDNHGGKPPRRDFLYLAGGAFGAFTVGAAVWPLIDSLNPAADTRADATVDVDLGKVQEGSGIRIMWRGKPVFVRYRTEKEIAEARDTPMADLPDPQSDEARVREPQWLIVVGVCTHLGCVPLGTTPNERRGDYGGWFCPCHASHYDTSGRIRRGPAPTNLEVPPYVISEDNRLTIGVAGDNGATS